jgi:hypothetical protein
MQEWIAPNEACTVEYRSPVLLREPERSEAEQRIAVQQRLWVERRERAEQALAASGREPVVRARYWLGGGWCVSDREHAAVPMTVGDRHWDVWIPARPEHS